MSAYKTTLLRFAKNALNIAVLTALSGQLAAQEAKTTDDDEDPFEVIEVTANKRASDIRSLASSASALTGEQLEKMGAESLADYINRLPGVHFNDYQPGVSEVVIRGVSATTYHEQGQTTVGYFINDIPMSEAGWPIVIPDMDTFDLKRVEVLRGPQGTLYGASNLGGLVNYIAKEADTSTRDAAVELGVGHTEHAGEENYAVKAMVNAPIIEDKLAVRFVGLQRYDAGYLNNIGTGDKGSNDLEVKGFRGSVVYTPWADTKISYMGMVQKTHLDDQTYATTPTLNRDTFIPEPHDTEFSMHTLRLDQGFDFADLTLLGAYGGKESVITFDYTIYGLLDPTQDTQYDGIGESDSRHYEARLSSKEDSAIQWIVGAAYYSSDKMINDAIYQNNAMAYIDANPELFGGFSGDVLAPGNYFNQYIVDQENEDTAIFGEVSWDLIEDLNVTLGGRYFDTSSKSNVTIPPYANYPDVFSSENTSFGGDSSETGFTPKFTAKYQFTDDVMGYINYSEGFRVGGTNPNAAITEGAEETYAPDETKNYEIGGRFDFLNKRLLLDATYFRINWEDMQVRLFTDAGLAYVTNAGEAKIDGIEFTAAWRPTNWFDFNTSVTWLDARLSEFLPATYAANGNGGYAAGTALPGSAKWTIANNLGVTLEDLPYMPRISIAHRYVDASPVAFESVTQRGGFNIIDLKADLQISDQIGVSIYADNLFDTYGLVNSPFGDDQPDNPLGSVTRPRTFGAKFTWKMW